MVSQRIVCMACLKMAHAGLSSMSSDIIPAGWSSWLELVQKKRIDSPVALHWSRAATCRRRCTELAWLQRAPRSKGTIFFSWLCTRLCTTTKVPMHCSNYQASEQWAMQAGCALWITQGAYAASDCSAHHLQHVFHLHEVLW